MTDLLRREDVLAEILKWRLERGPISTMVYMVEKMPAHVPETKPVKWECFLDVGYFDMWRVRKIGERRFDQGFHVVNEASANMLVGYLNSLDEPSMDLEKPMIRVMASLAAAISLLKAGGKGAKKGAGSDKMFDQMIIDYERALDDARALFRDRSEPIKTEEDDRPRSIKGNQDA